MDEINESVDILVQHGNDDHSNQIQMVKLPQLVLKLKRPLYSIQQRNILSIRQYFQVKDWLLLPTYATINTMYLCSKTEFERKVSEHFIQTEAYKFIKDCSNMNQEDVKDLFNDISQQITWKLYSFFSRRRITTQQYIQMMSTSKCDENQINSVVFLPDTRMQQIVAFRPMMLCPLGPIIFIARFLHQCLQVTYCLAANSTTFNDGIDVIKAIEGFVKKGSLQSTTQFVTLEIKDLDIIFTHKQVIETLQKFLRDYAPTTSNLSSKTIVSLVRLFLTKQYFMYDKKLYQQTKGSNPELLLTKLLVNIYLFYWQQNLLQFLKRRKELFGRCFNTIFLTWKGPKRTFFTLFHKIKAKLSDLPIQVSIGTSVHYLGIEIIQNNGILRTKVSRFSGLIERYTLPYLSNYSLNQYVTIIRARLIHAVQACNNVQDFQEEYLFIITTCLLNRFPMDFIFNCIHQFFNEFNPSKLNYKYDQKAYKSLRQHIMTTNIQALSLLMNKKRLHHHNLDVETTNIKRMKN